MKSPMKLTRAIAVLTATLLVAAQAWAGPSLTPHRAEYKVKISVVSGRLNTELLRTENGYSAHHVIKPTGLSRLLTRGTMDVTSEFAEGPDSVKPVAFRSVDTIRKDPSVDLRFDWSRNQASGTVGDDEVQLQLDGMAYDSVSIQYALMHDLLGGATASRYTIFDVNKMRIADVVNVGTKQIKTKAGKFQAVGIQHQKEGSSRITTMWCVEELGYLPVVIEQHRKGKLNFRASLLKYSPVGE